MRSLQRCEQRVHRDVLFDEMPDAVDLAVLVHAQAPEQAAQPVGGRAFGAQKASVVDRHIAGPFVEAGVLHGDARGNGEGLDDRLIVVGELLLPDLVGQVQVPVDAVTASFSGL